MRNSLRLPAYGEALLQLRRAGVHPPRVWVIVGDDWERRPTREPSVCVGREWRAGAVSWLPVAGVPTAIVCRWQVGGEDDPLGPVGLLSLAAEVCTVAAPVDVHLMEADGLPGLERCQVPPDWWAREASRGALGALWPARWDAPRWPPGWSAALADDYRRRCSAWLRAADAELAAAGVTGE